MTTRSEERIQRRGHKSTMSPTLSLLFANARSNGSSSNCVTSTSNNARGEQLQLNDLSNSLASGCECALLHSIFLHKTLLASESRESNSYNDVAYAGGGSTGHRGTLYLNSCTWYASLKRVRQPEATVMLGQRRAAYQYEYTRTLTMRRARKRRSTSMSRALRAPWHTQSWPPEVRG